MKIKIIQCLLGFVICSNQLYSQVEKVYTWFNNPSFEESPKQSIKPIGWKNCGFEGETEPDIHPNGFWEVNTKASHGKTYLGMVVRENETWEMISQVLDNKLKKNGCYYFTIDLCMSEKYVSAVRTSDRSKFEEGRYEIKNFNTPIILNIWGSNQTCETEELLATSAPIHHPEWREYYFEMHPKNNYRYILFEAYYNPNVETKNKSYNGNILLDNLSPIYTLGCSK